MTTSAAAAAAAAFPLLDDLVTLMNNEAAVEAARALAKLGDTSVGGGGRRKRTTRTRRGKNRHEPLPAGAVKRSAARRSVAPFMHRVARHSVCYGLDTLLVVRQDDHFIVQASSGMRSVLTREMLDALSGPLPSSATYPHVPEQWRVEHGDASIDAVALYKPGKQGVEFRLNDAAAPGSPNKRQRSAVKPVATAAAATANDSDNDSSSSGDGDDDDDDYARLLRSTDFFPDDDVLLYEQRSLPTHAELVSASRAVAVTSAPLSSVVDDDAADATDRLNHEHLADALQCFVDLVFVGLDEQDVRLA